MNINATASAQQAYFGAYENAQGNSYGKKLNTILQEVPPKEQTDIKALLEVLDPSGKKDAMEKMAELNRSNLSVEDLVKSINEIFQTNTDKTKSSYPSSFSMYA